MSTFARLSATAIAASVTSGAASALAVIEDTLARLAAYDAHQPQVWISRADPEGLRAAARAIDARITGIHAHLGSGIVTPAHWREVYAELNEKNANWKKIYPDYSRFLADAVQWESVAEGNYAQYLAAQKL